MARRSKSLHAAKVHEKRVKASTRRRRRAVDREVNKRLRDQEQGVIDIRDDAYVNPDDSKFRSRRVDSLKTGDARVTGATAKAITRGHTLTKHEYDELERRER